MAEPMEREHSGNHSEGGGHCVPKISVQLVEGAQSEPQGERSGGSVQLPPSILVQPTERGSEPRGRKSGHARLTVHFGEDDLPRELAAAARPSTDSLPGSLGVPSARSRDGMKPKVSVLEIAEEDLPGATNSHMVCGLTSERRARLFSIYAKGGTPRRLRLKKGFRWHARRIAFSPWWMLLVSLLALVDCILLSTELSVWFLIGTDNWHLREDRKGDMVWWLEWLAFIWLLIITPIYTADLVMLLGIFRCDFFRRYSRILDTFAVIACLWTLTYAALPDQVRAEVPLTWERLARILRLTSRFARVVRLGVRNGNCPCLTAIKHIVSGKKRRFINIIQDFDLDLTYITRRVIAMGVPAVRCKDFLVRNRLSDVVRFFETYHPNKYLIINCCPEMPYPDEAFETGGVVTFDIQDHTPPTMQQFVDFLGIASEWMEEDPDNVIAVHCLGGKGRTGSFLTAWLVLNGDSSHMSDALKLFALARTQLGNRKELVGVETPSQLRYLGQVEKLLQNQGLVSRHGSARERDPCDSVTATPEMPYAAELVPLTLVLHQVFKPGFVEEKGKSDLVAAIHAVSPQEGPKVVWWSAPFKVKALGHEELTIDLPIVCGDVRVSIFQAEKLHKARAKNHGGPGFRGDALFSVQDHPSSSSSGLLRSKPAKRCKGGKEAGCLFFFIFHTSYVEGGKIRVNIGEVAGHGVLSGMDTAYKKPSLYNLQGYVELVFRSQAP